jgi:hypothetical protein
MKKRRLFLIMFLTIMLISFINAAPLSLSNLLDSISESNLIILLVFIISFALIFFSLSRMFKQNIAIAAVISFASSFGITYWVNKSGFDLSGWVYDMGISTDVLYILIPILALALAIFLIVKLGKDSLFIFGGFLLASSLFVYEKAIVIALGIILILFRLFMRKNGLGRRYSSRGFPNYLRENPFLKPRRLPNYLRENPFLKPRRRKYREKNIRGREEEKDLRKRRKREDEERNEERRRRRFAKENLGGQKFHRRNEKTERKERNEERKQRRRQAEEENKFKIEEIKQKRRQVEEERRYRIEEKEQRRRQIEEGRKRIEDKRFEKIERKQEVKQITANLESLKRTYNEIQRTNPSDPRLMDLIKEIKRIRKEKR